MRHPDFPSALALPPAWAASLRLRFAVRGPRTVLVERRHRGPLMVQKALYPEGEGICHTVVLHPPAGIAGGDTLDIDVDVEAGAHAVITTPGATKWYKSLGREAGQSVRISVAEGARLDWLPQENIVFDDARARIATDVTVHPGGSAIGWDAVVLGRQASGERWSSGTVTLRTRIGSGSPTASAPARGASPPLWIEHAALDATSALRAARPGMDGLRILGTLWAVGGTVGKELAETLAEQLPYENDLRAGVTCIGTPAQPLLLLRVLGNDMEAVRRVMVACWTSLRQPVHGVTPRPLRLWST